MAEINSVFRAGTLFLVGYLSALPVSAQETGSYVITNDWEIAAPLTSTPGNPARGRQIVRDTTKATCLICHAMPIPEEPDHGEIGPPLHSVGALYSRGELRLRLVDPKRLNPDTIMPSYYRVEGLYRVLKQYEGRSIYTAQEIEDVVAYLATLTGQ